MVEDVPPCPAPSCPEGIQQKFSLDDTIAIISQAFLLEHEAMKRPNNDESHLAITPHDAPYSLENIQKLGQRLDIAPQYLQQAIAARANNHMTSQCAEKINARPSLDTIRKLTFQSLRETLESKLGTENRTITHAPLEFDEDTTVTYTLIERQTSARKNSYLRALLTRKDARVVVEESRQKLAWVRVDNYTFQGNVCSLHIQDPRFIEACADTIKDICNRYNLKLTTECTFDPKKVANE